MTELISLASIVLIAQKPTVNKWNWKDIVHLQLISNSILPSR